MARADPTTGYFLAEAGMTDERSLWGRAMT
jgi:hypothetical protein